MPPANWSKTEKQDPEEAVFGTKSGLYGKPGVDKLRLHDLRHTAATNLARSGKDNKFIAQYPGHKDVKTSARYIHYFDDDLKKGAEELARSPVDFHDRKKRSS